MASKKQQGFAAPSAIQSGAPAEAKEQAKPEYYRFNAKMPIEFHDYLAERAWITRKSITQYINDLVQADMDAHPDWRDSMDAANKPQ